MELIRDYGLIIIFFILPVIFVIQPLLMSEVEKEEEIENFELLKRKKLILYRQIKELEMEYDLGNIDDLDFKTFRNELKQEVSLVISQMKK